MPQNEEGHTSSRFGRWFDETFHDWFFRSMIGPAQVVGAVHGADREAREQWKRDLENRKRYTREQREQRHQARNAERHPTEGTTR